MAATKLPLRGSIFQVKRNGRPTGRWVWEYRVPGTSDRPRTRLSFSSRREAEQARYDAAMLELATRTAPKRSQTVRQYGDWWLKYHRAGRVKASTLGDYTYRLEHWVYRTFGDQQLGRVDAASVGAWMTTLSNRGLSVSTINGARRVFNMLMDHAHKSGTIGLNPVAVVPPLKSQYGDKTQKREPWTVHEAGAALRTLQSEAVEPAVLLSLLLGLRRGEVLGLRWSDISLTEGTVSVCRTYRLVAVYDGAERKNVGRFDTPKTASSARVLPIPPLLREALGRHLMRQEKQKALAGIRWVDHDLVITNSIGGPLDPSAVTRQYKAALDRGGIRYIRLHDLRHTAATLALQAGDPLDVVSQALGHTDVRMTKSTYAPHVPGHNTRFGLSVDALLQEAGQSGDIADELDLDRELRKLAPAQGEAA